jgi:DNA-binding MarR family transcriptional regulator
MHSITANKIGVLAFCVPDTSQQGTYSSSATSALLTLLDRGDMSVTELAAIIGLSQPATTRLISKLTSSGLTRQQNDGGRTKPVGLTAKGGRRAAKLKHTRQENLGALLSPLTDKEIRTLDHLLNKMLSCVADDRAQARHLCRQCDHDVCSGSTCPIGSSITNMENGHDL